MKKQLKTRIFDGKTYIWRTSTYTESEAEREADYLKTKLGYPFVKVIEEPIFGRQMWAVYYSDK